MSYSRKNYLLRVKLFQEEFIEYKKTGASNTWIWEKYFSPTAPSNWKMSKRTFDEYLGVPAVRDLKKIEEEEAKQLNLFENEGMQSQS